MACVRVAGNRGFSLAACRRSRPPVYLCAPSVSQINLQEGCISPHAVQQVTQGQHGRTYASVGDAVKKVGAGWFRRKLYTLLIVTGLSGGALVLVSW